MTAADLVPSEHDEQVTVVQWLEAHRIRFFAVPNGEVRPSATDAKGRRYSASAQRLRAEGARAGVPDLIIVEPVPRQPNIRGVAIEMKRRKGGRLSTEQAEWLSDLDDCRWVAVWCKGADEAIAVLERLGYGKRTA